MDNRPMNFPEFMGMTNQLLYMSATPGDFEIRNSHVGNTEFFPAVRPDNRLTLEESAALLQRAREDFDISTPGAPLVAEQIIRPTGLLDPKITMRPLKDQIDETIELCRQRIEKNQRVLVTTLTKRTAEDLSDYLRDIGLKVRYLHSDIDTIERVEILRALRAGEFDILVGINLLREGLDLPEVSLVCVLDADKEGFLRSRTSLIQTAGRAARHVNGEVVLFADKITGSIRDLLEITEDRRRRQMDHNRKNGITPRSVIRPVQESLRVLLEGDDAEGDRVNEGPVDVAALIRELEAEMKEASRKLEYERAALLRDQIMELKGGGVVTTAMSPRSKEKPQKGKKGWKR
jgi:excinuclease ABC subunit B